MKRKTPIIHRVKPHIRNGKKVGAYVRGTKRITKTKLANPTPLKPKGYTVTLKYSEKVGDKETIKVIATSYKRAIDEAFEEKEDKRLPIAISVIDPSLGEIISWAGKRALKYGKIAANSAYRKAKSSYYDYETKKLVQQAYSTDPTIRTIARAKLRGKYPEVYDVMDISRT